MRKADKVFEQKPSVDALLITSEKNRFYYTGFASTFGYLVMLKEKNYFITDSRYIEMAKILKRTRSSLKLRAATRSDSFPIF